MEFANVHDDCRRRVRNRRTCRLACIAVLAAMAGHAQAQWSPDASMDLGMGYGQLALSQSALDGTRALGTASGKAFTPASGSASGKPRELPVRRGSLAFRSSPQVTHVVNARFAAWQARNHPELRAELAAGIARGTLQAYFRGILDRYGYDPRNLADVASAYYISLWRIASGGSVRVQQAHAVRRQMRAAMARDARMMSLPDAEKQEIAETFGLHTALALQGYQQLQRSGDRDTLRAFRRGLQANLAPQGPDLRSLALSDGGFRTLP